MFEKIVGMPVEQFDADIRGKTFHVFKSANALTHAFDWQALNYVLDLSGPCLNRMNLVKENERLDRRKWTVKRNGNLGDVAVPSAVSGAMKDGYSIVLDQAQEYYRPVGSLSEVFTNALGEFASINIYVSWKTEQCFLTHWDDHDVFILQTEGAKEWSVFRPTRPFPMAIDVEYVEDKSDLELVWEGPLERGDVLYLPRGWWHHAKCIGGAGSIHLTVGITSRTVLDLLRYLSVCGASDEMFRADLPRPASQPVGLAASLKEQLVNFVTDQWDTGLLERYWSHHYAGLPMRTMNSIPQTLDFDRFCTEVEWVQSTVLAPAAALHRELTEFALRAGGKQWVFGIEAYEFLEAVLAGHCLDARRLAAQAPGDLSEADAWSLLFELVGEGILVVADRPRSAGREQTTSVHDRRVVV